MKSLALLLDTDLFFSVKVTDTLKHIGYTTKTLRRIEDFATALVADRPAFALVNTGARGVDWRSGIAAAVAASVPVVAFGSHVDLATQREARDLGATSVIANSKLAADLPGVVTRTLRRRLRPQPAGEGRTRLRPQPVSEGDPPEAAGEGRNSGEP